MLHFFKQKPVLKNLIPENFADIHSHLLPGIDDGAKSIENSLSLMEQMKGMGFKSITTTPHIFTDVWNNSEDSILSTYNETLRVTREKHPDIEFKAAAEYMLDVNFANRLQKEKLLTVKDNFILVEISYLYPPLNLYDIIFEIQVAGYKPILAHPERYLYYHHNYNEYEKLKRSGCFLQLNLLSVVNYYGSTISKIADQLLKDNLYDFVGSDIHHQNHIDAFERKLSIKNTEQLREVISKNLIFAE